MGQLVYGCITPHGGELIPELTGELPERMNETRQALEKLGERMREAAPDAILVFTPHGTRADGGFTIANSESMEGSFTENNLTYHMGRAVHRPLARLVHQFGTESAQLPISLLNYGTAEGPLSVLPLDWGAMVPLRFMPEVPIVVVTPSRFLSHEQLIAFGKAVREAIHTFEGRVGVIASCDWSHTHDEKGPYGFHPMAEQVDRKVVEDFKNGYLEGVARFSEKEIEEAKPDGIWQTLILCGVLPPEKRQVTFLSYQAPTYFGLICAEVQEK